MPGGGDLDLKTRAIALDENDCAPFDAKPGWYAHVAVTDTGIGMHESTRRRIFDPFFTTKEKKSRHWTGTGFSVWNHQESWWHHYR